MSSRCDGRTMSSRPAAPLLPVGSLLLGMLSFQCGAALAKQLFPLMGAQGATAVRLGLGALILWLLRQPWRRLTGRQDWASTTTNLSRGLPRPQGGPGVRVGPGSGSARGRRRPAPGHGCTSLPAARRSPVRHGGPGSRRHPRDPWSRSPDAAPLDRGRRTTPIDACPRSSIPVRRT